MNKQVTILTGEPTIEVIAEMQLQPTGIMNMMQWVKDHRPECLPDDFKPNTLENSHVPSKLVDVAPLFPHDMMDDRELPLSHNELLVELAGRNCYHSFGLKAGKKSNAEYIANTQSGEIKHASILYHAKMTFFLGGISRRVSQELMRNYVGADHDREGSPSQESSRFTHHYGTFVAHPYLLQKGREEELAIWTLQMQGGYDNYTGFIQRRFDEYAKHHGGVEPKGMDRKRIYEAAIGRMPWEFETSVVWTTNPGALTKLLIERDNDMADAEFQRFAKKWKRVCLGRWPNLFPRFVAETKELR